MRNIARSSSSGSISRITTQTKSLEDELDTPTQPSRSPERLEGLLEEESQTIVSKPVNKPKESTSESLTIDFVDIKDTTKSTTSLKIVEDDEKKRSSKKVSRKVFNI